MTEYDCQKDIEEAIELYGTVDLPFVGGFILRDGTVIEIGEYDDHRIINIDCWDIMDIITYRFINRGKELFLRIHNDITWQQEEKLIERIQYLRDLHIDVYKNDILILSKSYEHIDDYDLQGIIEEIRDKLYED